MAGESAELNEYVVVFYNKNSNMMVEQISEIQAMNPAIAEQLAWQEWEVRHKNEHNMKRSYFRVSVRGPGQ